MPFLSKAWTWFANNQLVQILVAFVLALIGWKVVKANIEQTGRIKERERIAAAQAQTQAARVEHSSQVVTQERTHADQAIEARDSGQHYPTFDELPDAHKRILLGHRTGEAGS